MDKRLKLDSYTTYLLSVIISIFLITVIFKMNSLAGLIKYGMLIIVLSLFILQFISLQRISKQSMFFLPFLLFNFLYIMRINDSDAIMIVVNQIALYIYVITIYKFDWKKDHIKILNYIYLAVLPFVIIGAFFPSISVNENTLSAIILYMTAFPMLYSYCYKFVGISRNLYFLLGILVGILLISGSRSAILAVLAGVVTFVFWKFVTKTRFINNLYFFLICYIVYFITAIYPKIDQYPIYPKLNYWSMRLFEKPLLTGRDHIWRNIIKFVQQGPFLGYGSGTAPEDFYQTNLSSHNLYLQVSLQVGILGVVLLGIMFYFFWVLSRRKRNDLRVRLLASFMIMMIVHQTFEVTLTQNQFAVGLLQWTIIGLLASFLLTSDETIGVRQNQKIDQQIQHLDS